jgi:ArsR family transcriptional regulator, cadmium/lead-responsive transcriptional repressor
VATIEPTSISLTWLLLTVLPGDPLVLTYRRSDIYAFGDVSLASTQLRASLFHGFSDHSRLAILEQLLDGPRRVSDIVQATGLAQPNVSAHLACLWDCGLVARQRHGREVHYRLVPGVAEILAAADRVLAVAGETVGACPRYGAGAPTKESA